MRQGNSSGQGIGIKRNVVKFALGIIISNCVDLTLMRLLPPECNEETHGNSLSHLTTQELISHS